MPYNSNLVVNSDASTGDTSGWTVANVTVNYDTIIHSDLKVKVGDSKTNIWGGWFDSLKVQLTLSGQTTDKCFVLTPNATMQQGLTSGYAIDPKDMKLIGVFKFVTEQTLYDATVIGKIWAEVTYDDDTQSKFVIPCIHGVTLAGRDQFNDWILEEAICLIPYREL